MKGFILKFQQVGGSFFLITEVKSPTLVYLPYKFQSYQSMFSKGAFLTRCNLKDFKMAII